MLDSKVIISQVQEVQVITKYSFRGDNTEWNLPIYTCKWGCLTKVNQFNTKEGYGDENGMSWKPSKQTFIAKSTWDYCFE